MSASDGWKDADGATSGWLITGGCGFIGTSLVASLRARGAHPIRVIDDLSVGSVEALARVAPVHETPAQAVGPLDAATAPDGVELVRGDIRDAALALRVARGCDVIVHLAANAGVDQSMRDPRNDCLTNVLGTLNYLEAARRNGVRRLVFASSSAPIGEVDPPIHEELAPHPVSPYGASKLAGEGYCSAYGRSLGVDTVALRFGNVYGPGSGHKSSVVAKFIQRALEGAPLEVYGDGEQTRDFIYVEDLVRAIRAAARVPDIGGEVFQIATSDETTLRELLAALLPALEAHGIRDVEVSHAASRAGDVQRSFSDTRKARSLLGWSARVPLQEGLARTVGWYLEGAGASDAPAERLAN